MAMTALDACAKFFGDGSDTTLNMRVADALTLLANNGDGIGEDEATWMASMNTALRVLASDAPPNVRSHLQVIQVPFDQIEEAEAGAIVLSTGVAVDGVMALARSCADFGYTAPANG